MSRVLITHADEPIGRRLVMRLFRDEDVEEIFATGRGSTPRAFDALLGGEAPRTDYARVALSRHRSASDLFHSERFAEAKIDTVVHLPPHGVPPKLTATSWTGLSEFTAETRLVMQHCLESSSIRNLVVVGSAYVYRLHPGNANRLCEDSELDLDPDVAPETRAWIDSDMMVHGEMHNDRLRVVLLRTPSVVGPGGDLMLCPLLHPRRPHARATGFDPLCPLISERDLTRAIQAAVHSARSGIYNVAGHEALPLSAIARYTGRSGWSFPHPLLHALNTSGRLVGTAWRRLPYDGPALRYGMSLETRRAAEELGFVPQDRIAAAPASDGSLRIETTQARYDSSRGPGMPL